MTTTATTVSMADFVRNAADYIDMARTEPITLTKHNKSAATIISAAEYERLQQYEEAYWKARADAVKAKGDYVGTKAAMKFLANAIVHE